MSVSITVKWCATCQYWQGERVLSKDGKKVEYKSSNTKGTCTNFKSPYNNKPVSPIQSCGQWAKWSVIR